MIATSALSVVKSLLPEFAHSEVPYPLGRVLFSAVLFSA